MGAQIVANGRTRPLGDAGLVPALGLDGQEVVISEGLGQPAKRHEPADDTEIDPTAPGRGHGPNGLDGRRPHQGSDHKLHAWHTGRPRLSLGRSQLHSALVGPSPYSRPKEAA